MAHQRSSLGCSKSKSKAPPVSSALFKTTAMQRDLLKSRLARLDPVQLPLGGDRDAGTGDDDSFETLQVQVAGNDEDEDEDEERDSFPADLGQLKK